MTIYPATDPAQVDEIFRRINSYGKHLSRQELRVAGVTSAFAQLVRTLASRIRGDVSVQDKLFLSSMKQISITSRDLPYGMNVEKIFWVEQGILTREYIRQSRDEELIADMLGYVLLAPKLSSSAEIIDEFFGYSPDGRQQSRRDEVEAALAKVGSDVVATQFMTVHEIFRELVEASGKRFSELMFKEPPQRVPRYFQSVFLGIWELVINNERVITDIKKALKALDGAGKSIDVGGGGGRFSAADRERNVNSVSGLLRPATTKRKATDPVRNSWVTELENLLMQSHTEQSLYDLKQGFMRLDGTHGVDEDAYAKVFKTLAAMANHGKGASGYVIVGVADDAKTAERLKTLYGIVPTTYQRFRITGIEHEARRLPKGLDSYYLGVTQRLAASSLPQWAKDQIARDMRLMRYFDKSLLVLKVTAGTEPCSFDGAFHERRGSNIALVPHDQLAPLFRRLLA